jgi:hypothetical protein
MLFYQTQRREPDEIGICSSQLKHATFASAQSYTIQLETV